MEVVVRARPRNHERRKKKSLEKLRRGQATGVSRGFPKPNQTERLLTATAFVRPVCHIVLRSRNRLATPWPKKTKALKVTSSQDLLNFAGDEAGNTDSTMEKISQAATNSKCLKPVDVFDNPPDELKALPQWVDWRYEDHGKPKPDKVPYIAGTRERASSTDPATWRSYTEAVHAYREDRAGFLNGIGLVLTKANGIVGGDIDSCIDPITGEIAEWALKIVTRFKNTYWEKSPSGLGLRFFLKGKLPAHGRKKKSVELYNDARFLTLTGNHLPAIAPIVSGEYADELLAFHAEVFGVGKQGSPRNQSSTEGSCSEPRPALPEPNPALAYSDGQVLYYARKAGNSEKFRRLFDEGDISRYSSHSEADMALVLILMHYTEDPDQINRLFRQSKLYRPKWNERRGPRTYGELTIHKVLINPEIITVRKKVRQFRAAAAYLWREHGGSRADQLFLSSLHDLAERRSVLILNDSCRDAGNDYGVTWSTARYRFRRLVRLGWLVRLPRTGKRRWDPNSYDLAMPEGAKFTQVLTQAAPPTVNTLGSFLHLGHDIFRRGGLGKTAAPVLAALQVPCETLEDVAERSGVSLRTLKGRRGLMRRLIGLNLAVQGEGGYERGPTSFDEAAIILGVVGRGAEQREDYKKQSKEFREWTPGKRLTTVPKDDSDRPLKVVAKPAVADASTEQSVTPDGKGLRKPFERVAPDINTKRPATPATGPQVPVRLIDDAGDDQQLNPGSTAVQPELRLAAKFKPYPKEKTVPQQEKVVPEQPLPPDTKKVEQDLGSQAKPVAGTSEQFLFYGHYVGWITTGPQGCTLRPHKAETRLASLARQVFSDRAALMAAIEAFYSPEELEVMRRDHEVRTREKQERDQREYQAREARKFIGELYDPERPMRETAALLRKNIKAAVVAGTLPDAEYRLKSGHDYIRIATVHAQDAGVRETLEAMFKRYNANESGHYSRFSLNILGPAVYRDAA